MRFDRISIDLKYPKTPSGRPPKGVCGQPIAIAIDAHGLPSVPICARATFSSGFESQALNFSPLGNDSYELIAVPNETGVHSVMIACWENLEASRREGLRRKIDAGTVQTIDVADHYEFLRSKVTAISGVVAKSKWIGRLDDISAIKTRLGSAKKQLALLSEVLVELAMDRDHFSNENAWRYLGLAGYEELISIASLPSTEEEVSYINFSILVERERSASGFWYEMFPRSVGGFKGVIEQLPRLADIGVDVLYFPPIHPIGVTNRKGRNNTLHALEGDVGSPWAIGSVLGGHDSIEPTLGTLDDFKKCIVAAREHGMEIALDVAFQCSPDHPWLKEHPEWFVHRSDGSIAYAENPPKKYEDIVPINFFPAREKDRDALWSELHGVFEYWVGCGVEVFRVDNPHTKPIAFWEWVIHGIRKLNPNVVFLAEAFTRPKIMYKLAEVGFSQSYTYFTWRNTPLEVRSYVEELCSAPVVSYFRPNFWPNTPDILAGVLREGSRADFELRLMLAACLSPSFGIYSGYEFVENVPYSPTSEEYMNSEKYELKHRDFSQGSPLDVLLKTLTSFRRSHPAMQRVGNVQFLDVEGESFLAFLRFAPDRGDVCLVICNFDTTEVREGAFYLPAVLPGGLEYENLRGEDVLNGETYFFSRGHNFIRLDPTKMPGHLVSLTLV